MGSSLTVRKVESIDLKKWKQKTFSLKKQSTLENYDVGDLNIGLPKTTITKKFTESGYLLYKASMNSKTIEEPIYVYWNKLEERGFKEVDSGYQKVIPFNFCFNEDYSKVYVFSSKIYASLFLRRLKLFLEIKTR
jgi:hypothetical protein